MARATLQVWWHWLRDQRDAWNRGTTTKRPSSLGSLINEVVTGRNLNVADEVHAPKYVNLAMGDTDLAGLKAMSTADGGSKSWNQWRKVMPSSSG